MRTKYISSLLLFLTGVLLSAVAAPAAAQDAGAVLSVAVPDNMADQLENGLLDQFEAANPGVSVHVVRTGGGRFAFFGGLQDVNDYLDGIQEQVAQADVLLINSSDISPESTRAGYFLDLSPLVAVDNSLDTSDFFTPIWQSYQWDGGIWALPVAANVSVMLYDPTAFDNAGLDYPGDWWTLYDLETAARALLQYDANGDPIPPIADLGDNMRTIIRATLGQDIVDDLVIPAVPDFSNPDLADLMTTWQGMIQDNLFATGGGINLDAPILLVPSQVASSPRMAGDRQTALLPGGGGFDVSGYAISGGTQYPEAAYALATFLSTTPELSTAVIGNIPARRSLVGQTNNFGGGQTANAGGGGGRGGGPGGGFGQASTDLMNLLQPALDTGLSVADLRFTNYIRSAVDSMTSDNIDASTALQDLQLTVLDRLQTADLRATSLVQVAPPPTPVVLAPGEISLNFGVANNFRQPGGDPEWQQAADDFVASDPEVGEIVLDTPDGFGNNLSEMTQNYDCFYLSSNAVQGADLSTLLSLDPLLSSDPNFNPNDLVGNVLAQVQRENQTWAMPLSIQPDVMLYSQPDFNQAGAYDPYPGWTVSDFEDALRTLKIHPDDPAPFVPQNSGASYMLVLLAAYGGLPIDYSTDPITLHFDDAATVDAAQQVLDLARNGYIKYEQLGGAFGARGLAFGFGSDEDVALYNQLVNSFTLNFTRNNSDYKLTTFPTGSQISAVSYDLGTAYISASTQHPEACYRFISTLTQNPALFDAMPANITLLDSTALVNSQGQETADYYKGMADLMSNPNTILIPTAFSGGVGAVGEFLTTDWLNRAFDSYVLDNADLQAALEDAQLKATTFQQCIEGLPGFDPGSGNDPQGYFQQLTTCATQADPKPARAFPVGNGHADGVSR